MLEYLSSFDPTLAVDFDLSDEVPESQEGQQPFVTRIRAMPNEHFLSCLSMAFEHLLLALGRAGRVHAFLQVRP